MESFSRKFFKATIKWRHISKPFLTGMLTLYLAGTSCNSFAQNRVLDVGIRIQKAVNLYYENGLTFQYTEEALASERLYFGFSYLSSRFGSALASNAIKQDNFLLSTSYFFRSNRLIRPLLRMNIGYFVAELEEPLFDELPDKSLLLSPETGICYDPGNPFKWTASLGYNVITGDGLSGPGTLYPVFLQTSLSWDVFYHRRTRQ